MCQDNDEKKSNNNDKKRRKERPNGNWPQKLKANRNKHTLYSFRLCAYDHQSDTSTLIHTNPLSFTDFFFTLLQHYLFNSSYIMVCSIHTYEYNCLWSLFFAHKYSDVSIWKVREMRKIETTEKSQNPNAKMTEKKLAHSKIELSDRLWRMPNNRTVASHAHTLPI